MPGKNPCGKDWLIEHSVWNPLTFRSIPECSPIPTGQSRKALKFRLIWAEIYWHSHSDFAGIWSFFNSNHSGMQSHSDRSKSKSIEIPVDLSRNVLTFPFRFWRNLILIQFWSYRNALKFPFRFCRNVIPIQALWNVLAFLIGFWRNINNFAEIPIPVRQAKSD